MPNDFSRSDTRNNKLTTYKDNLLPLPPKEGDRRYLSRVMIRIADVNFLVHLVTPHHSKELFKKKYR